MTVTVKGRSPDSVAHAASLAASICKLTAKTVWLEFDDVRVIAGTSGIGTLDAWYKNRDVIRGQA